MALTGAWPPAVSLAMACFLFAHLCACKGPARSIPTARSPGCVAGLDPASGR